MPATQADLDAAFATTSAPAVAPPPAAAPPAAATTPSALDQAFATPPPAAPSWLGGTPIELAPPGPSGEEIYQAQAKQRASDAAAAAELLKGADTTTGAPVALRAEVGAAPTDADRLAAVRKWYPDARPVPGTNNFVYTDPVSGRKTSFQAVGLPWYEPSLGGTAALGGDVAAAAGGTALGLLGGAGGTAIGGPGVGTAVGSAAGFGVGSAAGREIYRRALPWMGLDVVDTRTPGQVAGDVALEAGINTAIPLVGKYAVAPIVSDILKPTIGTAVQTAARALDASGVTDDLSSKLPAGVATQSPGVQSVEGSMLRAPWAGAVRDAYESSDKALTEGAQNVAQQAAGSAVPPTPSTFASRIGDIAQNVYDRYNTTRESLDSLATAQIGASRPVDMQPLINLRERMLTAIDRGAPATDYQAALDRLDTMIDQANQGGVSGPPGTLPYDSVRAWRTNIGKDSGFAGPPSAAVPPTGVAQMRNLYGAVNGVLSDTARAAGPIAERAYDTYNTAVNSFRSTTADTVSDLMNPALRSSRLVKMAQSTAPEDQTGMASFLNSPYLTTDQRAELTGGFINQLGAKAVPGVAGSETFDMPTWLKNYNGMTPTARGTVFGGPGAPTRDALDQLATVQKEIGSAAGYRNTSNTNYGIQTYLAIQNALAGVTTGFAAGGVKGALIGGGGGLASGVGGPALINRLMQSAPFIRWWTGTYGINPNVTQATTAALSRLAAIGAADPQIKPLTDRIYANLTPAQQ